MHETEENMTLQVHNRSGADLDGENGYEVGHVCSAESVPLNYSISIV